MDNHNIHDNFVREFLSKKEEAISFLNIFLPKKILTHLQMERLEIDENSYVDENLKDYYSDLLFKIPTKTDSFQSTYILFEHKLYPDSKIHIQLLKYMSLIYAKQDGLNPILPIVFYHGRSNWKIPVKFSGLFESQLKEVMEDYFVDFRIFLIDLGKIDLERINLSLTMRIFLGVLETVKRSDLEESLEKLFFQVQDLLVSKDYLDYFRKVVLYIFNTTDLPKENFMKIVAKISMEAKEEIMTTAERLIQEGEIKGKLEGKVEGIAIGKSRGKIEGKIETAKNMLSRGSEIDFVLEVTGLTKEELQKAGLI